MQDIRGVGPIVLELPGIPVTVRGDEDIQVPRVEGLDVDENWIQG